jgi:hypothetical protein
VISPFHSSGGNLSSINDAFILQSREQRVVGLALLETQALHCLHILASFPKIGSLQRTLCP